MLRITVLITTYNREKCIYQLTKRLKELYPCKIVVVDDGSKKEIDKKYIDYYYKYHQNNGKEGWWRVVNKLFQIAKLIPSDYHIMLPDDIKITDDFIENAVSIWEGIDDVNKICLNLLLDDRNECWTGFKRMVKGNVFLSQWNDCCFICESRFFDFVGKITISKHRWNKNKLLGSGVGMFISKKLYKMGLNMYQVKETLVRHGSQDSVMNPEARRINPLKS